MTLTALNSIAGTIISPIVMQRRLGYDRNEIAIALRLEQQHYICPHCKMLHDKDEPVRLVNDPAKQLFFRHATKGSDRQCAGAGKSEDHIRLQIEFSRWLEDEGYGQCELEKRLPEIGRIADIYLEGDNGYKAVYEIQLSAIRSDILAERTNDYKKIELDVYWVLGRKAETIENMWWCQQNVKGVLVAEFNEPEDIGDAA